jgi:peptide/nickel transport system substrate-binding protein
MKIRLLTALVAALMAVISAAGLATGASAEDRPSLVVAVQGNPPSFEPLTTESLVAYRVIYNVFDNLIDVDYNNNYKLQPGLATEWKRIDGKTLELKLRPGVKFHDGGELTAEDVVFSFGPERLLGENAPGWPAARSFWVNLERVEKVDDLTVRFVMNEDDILLEQRIAGWTGQIVSEKAFRAAGSWEEWSKKPIGTGPYKAVENKPGEYMLVEAHDEYWGGKPTAKSVKFAIVPEIAARMAGLATNEYQIITDLGPDQLDEVTSDPNLDVVGQPVNNHRLLTYDQDHAVLKNPSMRRALNLAIDRQAIVDSLWKGRTNVPASLQWESFGDMYLADFPKYAYAPEEAMRLAKEAGYNGEPIAYRVLNNYYANELPTAQVLVEMWKAAGLNVVLEVKENWQQVLMDDEGRAIRNWSNSAIYPDPASSLSRQHGPSGVQAAYKEWVNDEFEKLAVTLRNSTDPAERKATFKRMLEIWEVDDPNGTVLHQNAMFYAKRKDVKWDAYPHPYMDFRPRNLSFQ